MTQNSPKSIPKKAPARKGQPTPEEYKTFIEGLEMRDVLLSESNARRLSFPADGAILGVHVKTLKPRCQRYADGFTVTAVYEIQVIQHRDGAEQPEEFGTFRVGFDVVYASKVPLTDAYFDIFKQVNLPLNVWPYVRQHVHQQSVLMGLPALVLPVHRSN